MIKNINTINWTLYMKPTGSFGITRNRILILLLGVMMAVTVRVEAQSLSGGGGAGAGGGSGTGSCDPSIDIETVSVGNGLGNCGFVNVGCDGTLVPTCYYLKTEEKTSFSFNMGNELYTYVAGGFDSDGHPILGAFVSSSVENLSGTLAEITVTTTDPFTCATTTTYSGHVKSTRGADTITADMDATTGAWDDGGTAAGHMSADDGTAYSDYDSGYITGSFGCSSTATAIVSTGLSGAGAYVITNASPGGSIDTVLHNHGGQHQDPDVITYQFPYTDHLLRGNMMSLIGAYPTSSDGTLAWALGVNTSAYYHLTKSGIDHSVTGRKMMYRFRISGGCDPKRTYLVKWQVVTASDGSPPAIVDCGPVKVTPGADPDQPFFLEGGEFAVPTSPGTKYVQNWTMTLAPPETPGSGGPSPGGGAVSH